MTLYINRCKLLLFLWLCREDSEMNTAVDSLLHEVGVRGEIHVLRMFKYEYAVLAQHVFLKYNIDYLLRTAQVIRCIGENDIKICIENCDGYEHFQKEAIELLLESKVFALTFDVGHNHGIGGTDEEFIMKHKDCLKHIHLHDAKGRKNHLALGTGEMDIEKYLNLAKEQNCRVVLETKTIDGLKQSVEWLKG